MKVSALAAESGASEESKLKKATGLLGLIAIGAGVNVGAALFLTPTVMAGITGSGLWVARLISIIPLFLSLPSFMVIGSAMPVAGGVYRYGKLVSVPLAISVFWITLMSELFGMAFMALGTGNYLNQMAPVIDVTTASLLVLAVFFIINVLGIALAAWVEILLTGALMLALLSFILPGLPMIKAANLVPEFPGGWMAVFTVAAITFQICGGGYLYLSNGGESVKARRAMLLTGPISIGIVILVSVLVELVAIGTVGWRQLAAGKTLVPVAQLFMPVVMVAFFAIGGAFVASASTIHGVYTSYSREMMVGAQDGIIPSFMKRVNATFGTPIWPLTVLFVAGAIVLLFRPTIVFLSGILNLGIIGNYILITLAAPYMMTKHPKLFATALYKPSARLLWTCSILSTILMVVFFGFVLYSLKVWAILAIALLVAGPIYAWYRAGQGRPVVEEASAPTIASEA